MDSTPPDRGDTGDSNPIKVLDGLEAVRARPGMYVGDVHDGSGLLHMVWELVGNSLDQHLARRASRVRVDVDADGWITVEDDGVGIPVDPYSDTGSSFLEVIFTHLFGSGRVRPRHLPHVHLGLEFRGWGLAPICALSSRLEVDTCRNGTSWHAAFEKGRIATQLERHGPTRDSGTRIRFRPDAAIFAEPRIDAERLETRLRELAWLHPYFAIEWRGERLPWRGGPSGWVRVISGGEIEDGDCFEYSYATSKGYVDIAMAWVNRSDSVVRAFVNGTETCEGTHLAGMWRGLVSVARRLGCDVSPRIERERLAPGLVAVLHVGLIRPTYRSPDRSDLSTPVARTVVARAVTQGLPLAMGFDPNFATTTWPPKAGAPFATEISFETLRCLERLGCVARSARRTRRGRHATRLALIRFSQSWPRIRAACGLFAPALASRHAL